MGWGDLGRYLWRGDVVGVWAWVREFAAVWFGLWSGRALLGWLLALGPFVLALVLGHLIAVGAFAQTPVSDDTTHAKLDSVISEQGTTNTRLGNLEVGLVTVQQAQATQTALLADLNDEVHSLGGVATPGATPGPSINDVLLAETASAKVGLGAAVASMALVGLMVALLVTKWR